ncbi:MAG: outer membrane protein assembly factor BamD [Pseudomonadales bacterium]|jgi:outer membrane protein assembly factor BamD|nr:outer membrane protein assembly factor BamD [Pseudomonadales bacterium]|tara:strand:- start:1106 stop:2035 length:930 start_codon:yes stop_codon:yes gene_type:complete
MVFRLYLFVAKKEGSGPERTITQLPNRWTGGSVKTLPGILLCTLIAAGCASNSDDQESAIDETERQYYESSQRSLRSANYQDAISKLQRLEARYPFGRYAEQAQLELIYAYYNSLQPESARSAADRFIRLHPQHPNVDYAYYLRAMASYREDRYLLDRFLPLDPSKRDPGAARDSFDDFAELINRFPDSKYAPDARARMVHLRNLMAASEINIAKYYIYRGAYIAAANRGRYVFENFQQTPSVADALAIMVEAYLNLELSELAEESLQVLATNYPDHPSLDESGNFRIDKSGLNSDKSWLNIITFGLFG